MKKFAGLLTAAVLTALTLTGCAGSEAAGSADATAEHPLVLNLAHNLAENHITSIALQEFADNVEEKSGGRIRIRTFSKRYPLAQKQRCWSSSWRAWWT